LLSTRKLGTFSPYAHVPSELACVRVSRESSPTPLQSYRRLEAHVRLDAAQASSLLLRARYARISDLCFGTSASNVHVEMGFGSLLHMHLLASAASCLWLWLWSALGSAWPCLCFCPCLASCLLPCLGYSCLCPCSCCLCLLLSILLSSVLASCSSCPCLLPLVTCWFHLGSVLSLVSQFIAHCLCFLPMTACLCFLLLLVLVLIPCNLSESAP
jgi:hypothetical protein